MQYWLKKVGRRDDPLPAVWWEQRPELVEHTYFSRRPSIKVDDTLIYYAVGSGRLCGVLEAVGPTTQRFTPPADWDSERRGQYAWAMPVRLLHKCRADATAPHYDHFRDKRVAQGSHQRLEPDEARRMIDAINAVAVRNGQHGQGRTALP